MACKNICKLCPRFVISQAVTYADGVLTVNLPAGSYQNGCKYCIVVAQTIPSTAIIGAPVVVTIGTGTVQYPLIKCNCKQVTASALRTRTRYSTVVETTPTGGSFKLLGKPCCSPDSDLASIDGTAPTT